MALLPCPECGNMISEHAAMCPHCGIDRMTMMRLNGNFESIVIGETLLRINGTGDTYFVPENIRVTAKRYAKMIIGVCIMRLFLLFFIFRISFFILLYTAKQKKISEK